MTSERNKRIAKNTLMLYFRQQLILFVSLYTVRGVLDHQGAYLNFRFFVGYAGVGENWQLFRPFIASNLYTGHYIAR